MIGRLVLLGVSHQTAPLALRERLANFANDLPGALERLRAFPEVAEGMVLSTCNRVELYGAARQASSPPAVAQVFRKLLASESVLPSHFYEHRGEAALRHLFRVASSLDSMVIGEAQILGQLKHAYQVATSVGATGDTLQRAVGRAFSVAKRVRTETEVGRSAVSMGHAAVELCRKVFDSLADKRVLVVGAGEMARLAAAQLASREVAEISVANRSPERAQELQRWLSQRGARVATHPLEAIPSLLATVDIVLVATTGPGLAIGGAMVDRAFKARRYRPLLIVDLSVPRAVDPRVRAFENVFLKDIDDIGALVALNTATRIGEATRAEAIIETELAHFVRVARGREAMPVLAELRRRGDAVARAEIQRTLQQLGPDLTGRQRGSVEAMAQAIVNKLLHEPTAQLREAAERGGDSSLAQLTAELFGLSEGELEEPPDGSGGNEDS